LSEIRSDTDIYVDIHVDNDNLSVNTLWKQFLYAAFQRIALPLISFRTDGFLPVNPFAKQYVANLGIPKKKIQLLPLGVDTKSFHPDVDGTHVRRELGIDDDEIVLITAGNFNETKDLDILIEAFSGISRKASLILLGDGEDAYMDEISSLVNQHKLADSVFFHDRVPHQELPHFFAASDVGIWPGKLGITIIEAIGCGLPIIVCDSPATEFLTANDNGLIFPRREQEELTNRVQMYLSKPSMREQHAKNGVEYVQKKLAWEQIADKSIEIYKQL
jgi:glycosyltransferase involved in cell wall biosynthesis